jgi:ATP-dependent HslUV protease subunit HslV
MIKPILGLKNKGEEEKGLFRGTTILSVRHKGRVVLAGDGQVSLGNTIMKHNSSKIRRMYNDQIIAGFAGAVADAFALFSRLEAKLEEYRGNLPRAAVELAKDWRTDKILRPLEALLAVADKKTSLIIAGTGEIIEPEDGIIGIGSGGAFALAAARALLAHSDLDARQIAQEAMRIAASICIYTNEYITIEELETD